MTKMEAWEPRQAEMAHQIVHDTLQCAVHVDERDRSDDSLWKAGEEVYTGTAVDESWRSWFGMSGGKPWASGKRL